MSAMEQLTAAESHYFVAHLLAQFTQAGNAPQRGSNGTSSSYPNQDWWKKYACGTRGRPRTWEPLVADPEVDTHLDLVQVNHRLLNQIKDGAVKHEMSFLEVSPSPRWILTALFIAKLIVAYYEGYGEHRLTAVHKYVLDCAKRSAPEYEKVKRTIEAKGGVGIEIWSSWEMSGGRVDPKDDWLLMDFDIVIGKKAKPEKGKVETTNNLPKKPKDDDEDWTENLSRKLMEQLSIWGPDEDEETESNLSIVEGSLRVLAYLRDAADKKRTSLIEVSPQQGWIVGALFSIEMVVYLYEQRGEGSLSHFQRHALQTARRALQEFMEVKRSEEAKSGIGCDAWGGDGQREDVFIPLGVTDDMIKKKFGTLFNKTPTEWVGKGPEKAEQSAGASSARLPRVAVTPAAPSNRAERRRMAKESGANKTKATKITSGRQSKPATPPQPAASRGSTSDDAGHDSDASSCKAYEL